MELTIKVNNKELKAKQGETILEVVERNGMKIPTLCHMKKFNPSGACRICVVENAKNGKLIPSCSYPVEEGMEVFTHSQKVVESRKMIVELLLSNHPDDCLFCVRNGNCQLQDLSVEHNVTERRISGIKNNHHIDLSSPSIVRDPDKCILCGRCVRVCEETIGVSAIDYINRGSNSVIGVTYNKSINTSSCVNCGQCIMVCPTGALHEKDHISELQTALNDPETTVIAQYAPSISVSLAEEFGETAGTDMNAVLNTALRRMGFARVFDTSFSADLTIMEEASELVHRIQNNLPLPMFTSCCPAWVKYVEEFAPEFIPNLSSCKSPQQMLGAMIKSYIADNEGLKPEKIYSVSIMPCTAKKFEAQREEMTQNGISDVDAVLTTREFYKLLNLYGIKLNELEPQMADSPHGIRSSAGKLFGGSGGVMEAAVRTAYNMITGDELVDFRLPKLRGGEAVKEAKLKIGDLEVGVAVVNGLGNARKLLDEIRNGRDDLHFIEVMTCPGGCVAGGGQRIGANECHIEKRQESLYSIDETASLKFSHKNPEIIELYDRYLGKPLGHKSHDLLHTSYKKRDVLL
jgi:iron-only hydrogenase group A